MAASVFIGAALVGGAAYSADKARSNANKQADAAKQAADEQAATEKQIADQQAQQAQQAQDQMAAAEAARQQQLADADAETRRQAADADANKLTATPNVQLAAASPAGDPLTDQRKRRAAFHPDYASGLTL